MLQELVLLNYTPTEVELTQLSPEQELYLLIPDHMSYKNEGDDSLTYKEPQEGVDKGVYGATKGVVHAY